MSIRLSSYSCPLCVYFIDTGWALIVMPRSRSRSISSSSCSFISRRLTVPVSSSSRSANVLLPWSMCATIEKLRMYLGSVMEEGYGGRDAGDRDSVAGRVRMLAWPGEFRSNAEFGRLGESLKLLGIGRRG